MEENDSAKHYVSMAQSEQWARRFSGGGSLAFSLFTIICFGYGLLGFVVLVSALASSAFVFAYNYQTLGRIDQWWWIRRGVFLAPKDHTKLAESIIWSKEMFSGRIYVMPTNCIKFFHKSDAVAYKLVWC